jgi:exopolysaccharide production protein ExoQ
MGRIAPGRFGNQGTAAHQQVNTVSRRMGWHHFAAAFFILQGMEATGIIDRLFYGEWLGKPGNVVTEGMNILLILSSLSLFARGFGQIRFFKSGAFITTGLAGFFLCSAAWSIAPQSSIVEGTLYLMVILGAIGIAANFTSDEFMNLLATMVFLTAIASLGLYVASRGNAVSDTGDFRGIFPQKNVLGEAMTMGTLACLHGLRTGARGRRRSLVFLGMVAVVTLWSKSTTSFLTILAFCGTDLVISLIRKGGGVRVFAIGATVVALPVLIVSLVFPDTLLEILGKDPTLTGRTEIWGYVIEDIYQRPLLGWGYVAFWSVYNPAAMDIADALHWFSPQAHNGLLEILLHVGIVGASYFLFVWIRTIWLSVQCLQTADKALAISCLLSCIGILITGISETVLLAPFEASTGVFFITALMCERAVRGGNLPRPAGHFLVARQLARGTTKIHS